MFRNRRIAILLVILALLLLNNNPVSNGLQVDDFPIGLSVVYEIWINHWIPNETAIGYNIEYDITSWIDQDNLNVEYYIWTNVSTWEVSDTVQLSGIDYTVAKKTYFKWVSETDYFECFKLEGGFVFSDYFNSTSVFYEANLGLLVGFFKSVHRDNGSSHYIAIHDVDVGIIGTNFGLFYPLVTDPWGTTTTTTPETTGTTWFPDSTTTTSGIQTTTVYKLPDVNLVIVVGIIIEIFVIIVLIQRRK